MHVLDQAMKLELSGESLYRSFALEAADEGMAYIFTRLADQERKHYEIFKCMKSNLTMSQSDGSSGKSVTDIFKQWKKHRVQLKVKTSQIDLYLLALDVEDKSVKLYEDGARDADNAETSAIFLQVAAQERHHRQIMENIIEFVTKPDFWYEHAEYGYRGEDYYL